MPFYIVFRSTLKPSDIRLLLAHGYERIHKGLWIARYPSLTPRMDVLISSYSTIVLKTSRSLRSSVIDYERGVFDLGSLILIAYDLPCDPRIRKAVNRLIRRSPCFRLSPSIYLFPHARYEKYDNTLLISPNNLVKNIVLYGGKVACIPRLSLLNASSAKQVIDEFNALLAKRLENIYQTSLKLKDIQKLKWMKILSETRLEIKTLNVLIKFFEREVGLNLKDARSKLRKITRILAQ